jgi:uncharacterized protein YcaQ
MPPTRLPSTVSPARLRAYRARTFRLSNSLRLRTPDQAVEFVNERGFVFFWTIEGVDLPSLWTAVAGDRPVASEHDDPGHVTWGWKDALLGSRRWFYGKLLRGKSMMVSLKTLPYFYALSERLGDVDDFEQAYEAGRLSREARAVAEVLLKHGAHHTVALRRMAHLSSEASKAPFDKAISDLQRGLWVLPIGVAEAGAWRYAFIYDLVDRWFPGVVHKARRITRAEAQRHLARLYLDSVGTTTPAALRGLFRWPAHEVESTLEALRTARAAVPLADGSWATMRLMKPQA